MANGINSVTLVGNLTRDPELRTMPNGNSVCKLGLAVNENVKDGSGDWTERANFFDITVFGTQGENCAKYLTKGRPVAVQGRLRWSSWETEDGKRSKVEVIANMVQFLNSAEPSARKQFESDLGEYTEDLPKTPPASSAEEEIPF